MSIRWSLRGWAAVIVILLVGLIGGCSDGNSNPPGVIKYVNIDTYANNDTLPQVASNGTDYLVVYDEIVTDTDHDIIGARLNKNGSVLGYVDIEITANDDRVPHVAFDGTNYLVVYQQTVSSTDHDIMGIFVTPAGAVGTPFAIDASPDDDLAPVIAYNGTNYLVAYQRANGAGNDIRGAMVNINGTVLPGSPFDIDTGGDDIVPAVASNGVTFLVAYQRVIGGTDGDILGAIVDPSISATPPAVTLFDIDATPSYNDQAPAVASDGTNYLVVYQEVYPSDRDIRGAIIDPTGPSATLLFGIDTAYGYDDYDPSVAWSGTRYLVPYTETYSSTDHDILQAKVSSSGAVSGVASPIDTSPYDDFNSAVAYGSGNGLVAYEDVYSNTDHDILGALMTR